MTKNSASDYKMFPVFLVNFNWFEDFFFEK